jgi:uncharacterized coiled-coil protein SlyX
MNEQKIISLEEKIMILENNHEKLDKVVCKQQYDIDVLEQKIKQLHQEIQQQSFNDSTQKTNELPPHY